MSAWIVSQEHIDLMVTAGLNYAEHGDFSWYHSHAEGGGERKGLNYRNASAVGSMLWAENLASVAARYPDDADGERPGPNGFADSHVLTYRFKEVPGVSRDVRIMAAVAKAIDCYEYQACEHPGWMESSAKAFCDTLRRRILKMLPGYEGAPTWGFDERAALVK